MFIRVRVGTLGSAYGSLGSFGFAWVHSGGPRGRLVHSAWHGFTSTRLGVVGFIKVLMGSLRRALASSGSFYIAWVNSGARWGCRSLGAPEYAHATTNTTNPGHTQVIQRESK